MLLTGEIYSENTTKKKKKVPKKEFHPVKIYQYINKKKSNFETHVIASSTTMYMVQCLFVQQKK